MSVSIGDDDNDGDDTARSAESPPAMAADEEMEPLDEEMVLERAASTGAIVTAENHSIIGGLGSAVAETLMEAGVGLPFERVGIRDRFCEGGTTPYLMNKFGLDNNAIAAAARRVVARKR